MPDPIRLAMVGEGAIADIHMASFRNLANVEIPLLVYGIAADGKAFADKWGIPDLAPELESAFTPGIDGVVIASPSSLHAQQAMASITAGKHTLVEIPVALTLDDSEALAEMASTAKTLITMICHTRRFSPAHLWIKDQIAKGAFNLQHLVAETFFFRRENLNMAGKPRTWVDSLLWHHSAHTIDLFVWLTEDEDPKIMAQAGPLHPELGIPMDMTIGLKARSGALLTLSLSFNNQGPFGGFYRYIGDSGTYHVFRDELKDHEGQPIPVNGSAYLDQANAFLGAVRGTQPPSPTAAEILPTMRIVHKIQGLLSG